MLTREEHLAMAQCLKEAIPLLSLTGRDFKQTYVCHAIERTRSPAVVKVRLKNWIHEQLSADGGHGPYISWLTIFSKEFREVSSKGMLPRNIHTSIQASRLAWMENMIKVLEC